MSKVFDLDMIKAVYSRFPQRVEAARKVTGKPLTLTEKILYTHLWSGDANTAFERGKSYVDFAPDRVAMQDATAQMALLQFMQAGRKKVAVPSTVHCDHLIQARVGSTQDLSDALQLPVFDFE
jgi:aconitate hydratase